MGILVWCHVRLRLDEVRAELAPGLNANAAPQQLRLELGKVFFAGGLTSVVDVRAVPFVRCTEHQLILVMVTLIFAFNGAEQIVVDKISIQRKRLDDRDCFMDEVAFSFD